MIVIPGRIPILIHPFFWVFSALIGWIIGQSLVGMFVWMGIIFVSVLFHEFGHALMAVAFKQKTRIQLVAMGGLTMYEGPKLKFWQQFLITFNGPFFGFLLFIFASLLLQIQMPPFFLKVLKMTQIANLFWTVVNLLPVLPLDGGQLLRIVLEAGFGVKGFKASLLIGAILATGISLYFFLIQAFLIGAFFFLFAFQSFDSFRKSRYATHKDRDDENKNLMIQAENALQMGEKEEAKRILNELKEKAQGGMLGFAAQQYLAFLAFKEGKRKECYDLLLPIKDHLADDTLSILHDLAAEQRNFALVVELSQKCFQIDPSQRKALNNARAFAFENQAKHAGGWLQTAWQYGKLDLKMLLQEEEFQKIQNEPEFREFVDKLI